MNHSGSNLSESDSMQVSDLVTGNTSTGSDSKVQSFLNNLKAPQRSELTRVKFEHKWTFAGHDLGISA